MKEPCFPALYALTHFAPGIHIDQGHEFRLTDVRGQVVREIIA